MTKVEVEGDYAKCIGCSGYDRVQEKCVNKNSDHFGHKLSQEHHACVELHD